MTKTRYKTVYLRCPELYNRSGKEYTSKPIVSVCICIAYVTKKQKKLMHNFLWEKVLGEKLMGWGKSSLISFNILLDFEPSDCNIKS